MLTPKQEGFCQSFVETGDASEAYRRHYVADNMKPETINRAAKQLLDNAKIATRIGELRKAVQVAHNITIESILAELEEARQLALKTGKAGPAVQASMGKAKLAGLDKQIIDHTSSDGTMTPRPAIVVSQEAIQDIAKHINDGI